MKTIFKKPLWFTVITSLCLVVVVLFAAGGCDKSEDPPKSGNISFTPCRQVESKSGSVSEKVEVAFTDKGIQITHYNFEVTCDFTTVGVTHTFVNGVLNITQQGSPNQANCICYTDVSYTIDGISRNEVNVIFINGEQVYCYNKNYPNKYGYIVGYETCGLLIENGIGQAKGYIFISEDLKDTLAIYKFPQDIYDFQAAMFSETREWYVNVSFPEQYRDVFKTQIIYTISSLEEIRSLGLNADCTIPAMYPIIRTYHNCVPAIIHSANKIKI